MAERPDPNNLDETLPRVDRSVIDDLFAESHDEPAVLAHELRSISLNNPALRDLLYATAARKEPEDLEARQKIVDTSLIMYSALGRASLIKVFGEQIEQHGLAEPRESKENYISPQTEPDAPTLPPEDVPPTTQIA